MDAAIDIRLTDELDAVLSAAFEAFLRMRLERRAGRRGKMHRRAFMVFADVVKDMAAAAGPEGEVMWRMAVVELERGRSEIENEVMTDGDLVEVEHEWAAFSAELELLLSTIEVVSSR